MKILRPQEIQLLRMTGRVTLANGGGGGGRTESNQSTNTTTSLTNQVSSNDTRSVASDHAIAVGGSNNALTQNTTNNSSTATAYSSNSGNSYKDSGNTTLTTSTSYSSTTTDFGSVQAAIDSMKATAKSAIGLSGDVAGDAIGALTHQSDNTMSLISNLFEFAKSSSANSQGTAMHALGLASSATEAATDAKGSDKKHMTYALIAGGVLLAIIVLKR